MGAWNEVHFELAGKRIALHLFPNAQFFALQSDWTIWVVLAAGVLYSGLLGMFLLVITGRRWLIEQVVRDRTHSLEATNEELAQRMDELRSSEERFRLLATGVKDYAIYSLDLHGLIASWNIGAQRMYGYSEEEIIGVPAALLSTSEDTGVCRPEQDLAATRLYGTFEGECWRVRRDGSRFWGRCSMTAVMDENGKLIAYSTLTHDLTETKKRESELNESVKFIKLLRVVSGAAHHGSVPKKLLQFCLDEVCALTGWPRLFAFEGG